MSDELKLLLKAHGDLEHEHHLLNQRNEQLVDRIVELQAEREYLKDLLIQVLGRKQRLTTTPRDAAGGRV